MTQGPWVAPGAPASAAPENGSGAATGGLPPGAEQGSPPGSEDQPVFRPDLRPGIAPLRPLTLGDVYGAVTKAIRANPTPTVGAAMLVLAIIAVPAIGLATWFSRTSGTGPDETLLAGVAVLTVVMFAVVALQTAAMGPVLTEGMLGRRASLGGTWRAVRGRLLALVLLYLGLALVSLLLMALLLAVPAALAIAGVQTESDGLLVAGVVLLVAVYAVLVAGSLYLQARVAFAPVAVVVERLGPLAAVRRSLALSRRSVLKIVGIRFLTSLLVGFVQQIVYFPLVLIGAVVLALLGVDGDRAPALIGVVVALALLLSLALTVPFSAGSDVMLYIDERIRKEGLDVALVQTVFHGAPEPWTRPGPPT